MITFLQRYSYSCPYSTIASFAIKQTSTRTTAQRYFAFDPPHSHLHPPRRPSYILRTMASQQPDPTTSQFGHWPASKVRQTFMSYFSSHPERPHTFVPSAKVIPYEDPTLLFINSGMAPFKQIFLGTVDPNSELGRYKRVVDSQKCIRAGGKHNDLDDVGKDTYHHTFFEMLGNWSFGDYFKKEAISYAWELLTHPTKGFGLPKDRLYVTYFEGDAKQGLEADEETRKIWLDLGVDESRILKGNAKDNFWEMGPTGPCGPCSEIHYDRVGGRNASDLVNQDDPLVLEIWNNVFMQYNREPDGSLKPLPNRHVDTGMGFERLVSVLQDKSSNYDTDVFAPLFEKIRSITGVRPYSGKVGKDDEDGIDTAYRVVADHVRTLTFAICDGGIPSNIGRGYVLRRILRRGVRYARKRLNVEPGEFFSSLVPTLVEQMGDFFPEIKGKQSDLKEILDEEELSFARTLDRGEKLFETYSKTSLSSPLKALDGKHVWRLYDTYGFPSDLTELMAQELGLKIDWEEFEKAKAESKEASKGVGKVKDGGEEVKLDVHDIGALEKMSEVPKTDDVAKYGAGNINSTIKAIYHSHKFHTSTEAIPPNSPFGVILDKTCFYAESGGQENDTGTIAIDGKAEFEVADVQVSHGYVLHVGVLKEGQLKVGDEVIGTYDELRRWPIRNNHTGTHILNFGLREILGDHIDQKGSLVAPTKLRFDFSHKGPISPSELGKIEEICNAWIKKNVGVYSKEMTLKEAQRIPGLRAVFGEAYPDPVRVVALEFSVEDIAGDIENPKWRGTSVEFCGGTHVAKTGDIKNLVIVEESGIAKGIRRVIAVTGHEAREVSILAGELQSRLENIQSLKGKEREAELKAYTGELDQAVISVVRKAALKETLNQLRKKAAEEASALEKAELSKTSEVVTKYFEENPNAKVLVQEVQVGGNSKALGAAALKAKSLGKAIYLFSVDSSTGKVVHANALPPSDIKKGSFDAKIWIAAASAVLGGKGGGKEDAAQGVGTEVGKVKEAIEAVKKVYEEKVGA